MRTTMIVPESKARRTAHVRLRSALRWTTRHPASHDGIAVLLDHHQDPLDGQKFRIYRDTLGAHIETTDLLRVYKALDLPEGEAGIKKV